MMNKIDLTSTEPNRDLIRDLVPYHHVRYAAPCNLDCFYCYERPHRPVDAAATLSTIEESLDWARHAAGYQAVVFGAGELLRLAGWPRVLRRATHLGFQQRYLISNLTLIDATALEQLLAAGLTGLGGTLFAGNDADARCVAGRTAIVSRQRAALRLASRVAGLHVGLHVIVTRHLAIDLTGFILSLRDAFGVACRRLMVSTIEPISAEASLHPSYVHGLDLDWPALIERMQVEGIDLIVQNVPACLLGPHAHRSFFFRKRVARLLAGWPAVADVAARIAADEILYSRVPARGNCLGCGLQAVCHRFFDYPVTRKPAVADDQAVVAQLLKDEGIVADARMLVQALRDLADRSKPDARSPLIGAFRPDATEASA